MNEIEIIDDILSVYNNNFKKDREDKEKLILWLFDIYIKNYIDINENDKHHIINMIFKKMI